MSNPAHILKTARRQMRKIRHRGPKTETERRLLASADQQREQGLGWRFDGFGAWSNEEMFAALGKVSIAIDEHSFRTEAAIAGSPTRLWEGWQARSTAEGKWRDLPMLAARELWRRLVPGMKSAEVVSDQIDELLERAEIEHDRPGLWLQAARLLVAACVGRDSADRGFFDHVVRESGSDVAGWMVEMPAALLDTPHAAEAPGLCESFAQLVDPKSMLAERAELLAHLGRKSEAVAQIEALLQEYPNDPVVLLKAGGTYELLGDVARAQDFLRRYSDAMQDPASARARAAAAHLGVQLPRPASAAKPNDRCWCGSGKKFKRCHGQPS